MEQVSTCRCVANRSAAADLGGGHESEAMQEVMSQVFQFQPHFPSEPVYFLHVFHRSDISTRGSGSGDWATAPYAST